MAGQPIPNVDVSENASGVGIIVPGTGPLPVNVAGWTSTGPAATPTPVGQGQVNTVKSTFGVGPAVELAAAILANGAPGGVILTRIYDGTIASPFTRTGSGPASGVTCTGSPMGPYGTPTSTGSTGVLVFIAVSGTLGTSEFQVSLNGGATFSPAQPTAATYLIPNTGLTLAFAAGSYVEGDTYVGAITTSLGAAYTLLGGVNTQMTTTGPGAQQLPVPGNTVSGGGTILVDTTDNPQDAYQVVILIVGSGVLGVGTFQYSLDGGLTFQPTTQIPSGGGPTSLGGSGIAVDWANGNTAATYLWNDTTDSDTVTFAAGTSFNGALGNSLKVVVQTGSSLANSVATAAGITTVTLTIDTGVTTPTLLATYVNTTAASALAAYITISAHTGTTPFSVFLSSTALTGGVGGGGSTSGFVAGESYVFTTVPPAITNTDILNVGEAITGNKLQWDWMHVVGRPATISGGAAVFSTLDTIANFWFTNARYSFCVQDQVPCTQAANVETALVTAYSSLASNFVAVGAGDCNIVSATGLGEVQRCNSWAASIWGSTLPIGTDLAEEDLGALSFVADILLDQNQDPTLTENGFTALRTIPNQSGFYVSNAFIYSSPSSDITFWQSRRVLNQACRIAYAALQTYLSKPILVSASTGTILPAAATAIQNYVLRELTSGLQGQVSGVACVVNTTNDVLSTETLEVTVGVVPLFYPKYIDATIGFVNPALSSQ